MSTPTQKKKLRDNAADFMRRAEVHELQWHYTQARPFGGFGRAPEKLHANDCSGYVSLVYYWAMKHAGLWIADPLGVGDGYNGWGYTGTEEAWLRKHGKRIENNSFYPLDIAMYDGHTTVCKVKGSHLTSRWSSFGQELGPQEVTLHYRDDLRGVWRHSALL